jgi:isopenicillin N synthase-like dioxygenase
MDKDVQGLQVLRDGTWYNVPTVSNYTLLINVGVTMEVAIPEPQINFFYVL